MDRPLVDKMSFILTLAVLIFSFILFSSETGFVFGSILAALIAAGTFWVAYVLVRWLILALRK